MYGANEFFFENGVTGYFGGQHHGLGATIVDFAVWDSSGLGKVSSFTSQPMGPFCSRFGNEGTGAHCERAVDLFKGREYSYHVELSMLNASGAAWSASIVDEYTGNESSIGQVFLHTDPAHAPPTGSKIQVGYGGLTTAVCDTCPHMRNRTEPTDPLPYGGISFMEYFLGGSFYSSFGWIGPRFFPSSSVRSSPADGGASVRRGRGPRTREQGVVLPQRILVDQEGSSPRAVVKSKMSGCIPGYPECGGDRVFYEEGPDVEPFPAAHAHAWIYNGTAPDSRAVDRQGAEQAA